jgi:YesN/AraC family two-component response regulator
MRKQSQFYSRAQLKAVFQFIAAHYHQSISLCDVAKAVGYSPAYLTDLVRRETGQTVNQWIIEHRLNQASCLLLATNQTVSQIAETVGYQNINYFFRQFRHYYGTTPQIWRKLQRDSG